MSESAAGAPGGRRRARLTRERILDAAIALADREGVDPLSMRRLADELGVVPMALYKHIANKEELLDGMVDVVIREIEPPAGDGEWKPAIRRRILSARSALLRHWWASRVIETRTNRTPAALDYMDSMIATFRAGGFSVDLTHHVMHAIGSRMWGFTQELYSDLQPPGREVVNAVPEALARRFPHIVEIARVVVHDDGTVVGQGCDDQFEFEFALDLLLDGFEKLHREGWTSARQS